ncbi:hypothetical protein NTE_01741 [Candidatus Nitrososphaera evergladensis SR1]|uniref:Uncharacterized protein n=1 Tax=Candidatus Nitrososphaera evergladensis SR1 TaxID=1459636 RepID=A0A075MSP5_9ARCH|nr:hypothetical protein [Candidatus Nitrososphaera evergladensis]AIF83802.1 hypothetical protein NTE_01741 [Candidatus Nitrososphaera evergladensis SR1]
MQRRSKPVAKKAKKARKDEEQITVLLREILAELRRLNTNLERRQQTAAASAEPAEIEDAIDMEDDDENGDSGSEELEYFE